MDFDVSGAVAGLAAITAGVALIGAAKLLPAAAAVGWKWMKATIFG
ncbi:major capsid protein [Xanthomonas arboricola]|nr:major capsid protein [Xanthomonas arboricola]